MSVLPLLLSADEAVTAGDYNMFVDNMYSVTFLHEKSEDATEQGLVISKLLSINWKLMKNLQGLMEINNALVVEKDALAKRGGSFFNSDMASRKRARTGDKDDKKDDRKKKLDSRKIAKSSDLSVVMAMANSQKKGEGEDGKDGEGKMDTVDDEDPPTDDDENGEEGKAVPLSVRHNNKAQEAWKRSEFGGSLQIKDNHYIRTMVYENCLYTPLTDIVELVRTNVKSTTSMVSHYIEKNRNCLKMSVPNIDKATGEKNQNKVYLTWCITFTDAIKYMDNLRDKKVRCYAVDTDMIDVTKSQLKVALDLQGLYINHSAANEAAAAAEGAAAAAAAAAAAVAGEGVEAKEGEKKDEEKKNEEKKEEGKAEDKGEKKDDKESEKKAEDGKENSEAAAPAEGTAASTVAAAAAVAATIVAAAAPAAVAAPTPAPAPAVAVAVAVAPPPAPAPAVAPVVAAPALAQPAAAPLPAPTPVLAQPTQPVQPAQPPAPPLPVPVQSALPPIPVSAPPQLNPGVPVQAVQQLPTMPRPN